MLVEDASRLSRKQADVLNLCERLKFVGLRICFISQGIDSSDKTFQLLLLTRGLIDQLFLDDTAKRVRRGMEGLIRRGLHTGGRCFGYRGRKEADGVRLEIDEPEAVIVRRFFQKYVMASALNNLKASTLNTLCLLATTRGLERSWSPVAISHILKNERYVGKVVWNKKHKVHNLRTGRRVFRPLDGESPIRALMRRIHALFPMTGHVQDRFAEIRKRCTFKASGLIKIGSYVDRRTCFLVCSNADCAAGISRWFPGQGNTRTRSMAVPCITPGTCSNAARFARRREAQLSKACRRPCFNLKSSTLSNSNAVEAEAGPDGWRS